ncbi:uncharacterized protein LOC127280475 isoform X2 [Leptopilina boulardi]|uniref:uncharacterized protein LOC127280475 isoform X2 n=1 Tax=Leptopilina boulardi TaxID=63433 RepID=UPI0021F568C8|nr:uncharacterized protein LOC127280475 isoform X2 [Leptopilina boulardi]
MVTNMSRLNDDCLLHIFQYLPIVDKIKMESVSHRWRDLSLKSWSKFRKLNLSCITWGFPVSDKFTYVDDQILKHVLIRCGKFLIEIDICKPFNEDGTISRKDETKVHIIGATNDILKIIATYCPLIETIFISDPCINLIGIRILIENCKNICKLCLVSRKWIWNEDELGEIFAIMLKLKYLKFSCNNITGKCLQKLPINLEELHLMKIIHSSSSDVSNAINRLYKLKALTIDSYPTINVELLRAIGSRNDNLQMLRLSGYVGLDYIKKDEIKEIARFENLIIFDFQHNSYITDNALKTLAFYCRKVQYINISSCFEISEKGIAHLSTKPRLEHLISNGLPKVTGENFEKMLHLKTLDCQNCHRLREENLFNLIRTSMNLEILDISWNKFNVNRLINIANISTMKNLKKYI